MEWTDAVTALTTVGTFVAGIVTTAVAGIVRRSRERQAHAAATQGAKDERRRVAGREAVRELFDGLNAIESRAVGRAPEPFISPTRYRLTPQDVQTLRSKVLLVPDEGMRALLNDGLDTLADPEIVVVSGYEEQSVHVVQRNSLRDLMNLAASLLNEEQPTDELTNRLRGRGIYLRKAFEMMNELED